ncbi:ABC transporter permease [Leadbettera azotonutricia]|uniref:Inner-membrane translocator n=1 Tax=Leadbettera azotonutricia (strain ATCC BAA-888 / DSM 13862 / ZAS-9) TaxID=545695 RepID=F5Y6Z2_LEAAZ|nr:ABC transporter permease [Leadbettera azotonutricia]AEF82571.1 inner-membrane translocator [Leadbettera azotonutricia ZAS-9]
MPKLKDRILEVFTGSDGLVSVAVVILGFLVGTILILLVGRNPAGMYSAILQVVSGWDLRRGTQNMRYIGEWIVASMPLILCGLSMGFAARTGLFNIGAEGQYVAGLTAAQFVALYFPQVPGLHWLMAILAAIIAGAVWGGIVGFLKARFSVSEVVATIMMNYIAQYGSRILTMRIPGTNTFQTPPLPVTSRLSSPFLEAVTNNSRLNYGLFLTIAAVLFYWIIMGRTRLGYSLRATGLNKEAARYGGISVNTSITTAMAIAGAFAGLAGAIVSLGSFSAGRVLSVQDGYGFDGIAVALVGNSSAWGTALSGLLFGMLKSAQPLMQSRQIPKEITSIIMGLVVVFISLRAGVRIIIEWQMKEKARKAQNAATAGASEGGHHA